MNIPNDCLVVELAKDVSHFSCLTWHSHGCPKTIPLDLYEMNKDKLLIVEDRHNLIKDPDAKTAEKPKEDVDFMKEAKDVTDAMAKGDFSKANEEAKDLVNKVKKSGKGKNKKR